MIPALTRRDVLRVAGLGALVLPAAACAAAAADEPEDELVFLISNIDSGWAPSASAISSYEANIWGQITDKLLYSAPDGTLSPWIATSWEQNADSTEFVLHLRDGITFSDGTPLDAAAVVANIRQWAVGRPDEGIPTVGLFPSAAFQDATADDPLTVRVTFGAPALAFLPTLGYHGCILLSPASLALSLREQSDLSRQIGSGPFVVESWAADDHVALRRREDYTWAPPVAEHEGPAHLAKILFRVLPDDLLRASAARGHQSDISYNVNPQILSEFSDHGFGIDVPRYLGFVHGYRIRANIAPFDDVRVRQAFQHGIDREEIHATVYTDAWRIARSWLQSSVPESSDVSALFAYDQELSASLLDEAGFTDRAEDGTRVRDGKPLEISLYPTPFLTASAQEVELIAQQLTRVGFRIRQQKLDVAAYATRVDANKEQPLIEVTRSFVDVGTVAKVLSAKGENWFSIGDEDPTLGDLRDRIAGAIHRDERVEAVQALERHVVEQAYFIPLEENGQRIYVQTPGLEGVTYNALAVPSYLSARKTA